MTDVYVIYFRDLWNVIINGDMVLNWQINMQHQYVLLYRTNTHSQRVVESPSLNGRLNWSINDVYAFTEKAKLYYVLPGRISMVTYS